MGDEFIILIENKAANVDIDCSGINGIWAGAIFYLLLSIIEGYKVSWQWFTIAFLLLVLIVLANVFRIVVLVYLSH